MDEIIDTLKTVFMMCIAAAIIYTKCVKEEKKEIKSMVPVVVPVSSYSEPDSEPSEPRENPSGTTSGSYAGGGGYYPVTPAYDNSGTGSYVGSTGSSGNPRQPTSRQCPYCDGTGRRTVDDTSIVTFGQTPYWKQCNECGRRYLSSTNHYHTQCSHCHGTGQITSY